MTAATEDPEAWFRRYNPAVPDAVQLLCLPHAGGAASYFMPLAKELAPAYDVVCVQYPGRQDRHREPAEEDLDVLTERLFKVVRSQQDQPLVLLGHSMGAVIGFELVRRLERTGVRRPLGLIASGRRAPVRHRDEDIHLRDDDGIIAEIRSLSGTAPGVLDDDELLRLVLPALRADYRAVETYRYQPGEPVRTPISVFTGDSDTRVSAEEAAAWQEVTSGAFDLRTFPGGHFYLNDQHAAVTRAVTECVTAFRTAAAPPAPSAS